MATGRVVRFDELKGYGFIAPDEGGEDVFVHANMLGNDKWSVSPGTPVEFEATDSDRGPKALTVRVINTGSPPPAESIQDDQAGVVEPVTAGRSDVDDDDGMCDILSERAFSTELTELLLGSQPDLTAGQVVAVRRELLALARRHGWVEG